MMDRFQKDLRSTYVEETYKTVNLQTGSFVWLYNAIVVVGSFVPDYKSCDPFAVEQASSSVFQANPISELSDGT